MSANPLLATAFFAILFFVACEKHSGERTAVFDTHFSSASEEATFRETLLPFLSRQGFRAPSPNSLERDGETIFSGSYEGSAPIRPPLLRTCTGDRSAIHAVLEWNISGSTPEATQTKEKVGEFADKLRGISANAQPQS